MLYVVPTPVGNLEDITFRALRVLKEVDLILAEDTRTSSVLLKHYDIHTPLKSHHKFNEHETSDDMANRIAAGMTVALISDAGTPCISDPGFMLVRACVERGVEVQCLPGPKIRGEMIMFMYFPVSMVNLICTATEPMEPKVVKAKMQI